MEISDIEVYSKSDDYYLKVIGNYIKQGRLDQNKTQQELADEAGINRTTLGQMEKGGAVNLQSLIQVLRVLKRLHIFREMEITPQLSPLKLAALEQKQRQRAGRRTNTPGKPKSDW